MRGHQREIDRVDTELERRKQEIADLQTRLQDAERLLVSKIVDVATILGGGEASQRIM